VLVALGVGLLLLMVIPGYYVLTGVRFGMYPGWLWLLPGLFAQAGIAEEVLFRGYLFRHVREGRSFWRAAAVASGPFVLVHLILFLTMSWPLAAASFSWPR
jgi:membrane protease YdiL (CAAX protease family)